ncbi:Transcriptional regulator [Treponema sp. JC4]|uniref:TetR/AcrR family transcriptional regulator n=1 Tax=Treponema sp. JC4 TaxID=1124982 RepID=UPI00025B0A61|nr:TetR/AcrR family transcriptional regulator [Treponema sp. JC4]EID85455.1 Transcriptional regulator [Treponema sp. JC4]
MSEEEVSTKEKIIQATFSLLKSNSLSSISLSSIAKEVNISKTAIYRHFKSKEDLEAAVQQRIFETIYSNMKEIDLLYREKKYKECIVSALRFLKVHPEIINYGLFSSPDVGEDKRLYRYCDEGVSLFSLFYDENHKIKDYDLYSRGLYVAVTMIDFLLGWFRVSETKENLYENFEENILKIIYGGLQAPKDFLSPADFAHLDTICLNSLAALPQLDKKLVALSSVVAKVGFPNVTVEAVATELGMVKSSLYTWFRDKQQMLTSLIAPEINMMLSTVLQNMRQVDSPLEKLYLLLKTETIYFNTRKKMLTACKWIQLEGNYNTERFETIVNEKISLGLAEELGKSVTKEVKERYSCFDPHLVAGWIFSFPVFLVVNAIHHEFSEIELNDSLRSLFNMIAGGLTLDKYLKKGGNV